MPWSNNFNDNDEDDDLYSDVESDNEIIIEAQKRFKICEDWEAQARRWFEYDYKFANGDSNNMYQ